MKAIKGGKTKKAPKLKLEVANKFDEKTGILKVQFAFIHKSGIFNAKGKKADKTYLTDVVTVDLTEHIDAYRAQVLKEIYDIEPEEDKTS